MIANVNQWLAKYPIGHWGIESEEEMQAVVESIPGANMVRNAHLGPANGGNNAGVNYRFYFDRGHLVVCDTLVKDTQIKHPLDEVQVQRESMIKTDVAGEFQSV